jgi:hypothetical protein
VDDPDVRARKEAENAAAARKAAEERQRQEMDRVQEAKRNFHRNYCKHGQDGTVLDVLGGNPYTNSDKCYQLLAFVVQWLGPTSALMNIDFSNTSAGLIKVDFSKPPSHKIMQMDLIGTGAFSYEAVDGAAMTIPSFKVIQIVGVGGI